MNHRAIVTLFLLLAASSAAVAIELDHFILDRKPKVLSPESAAALRGKRVYVDIGEPGNTVFFGSFSNKERDLLHSLFDPNLESKHDYDAVKTPASIDPAQRIGDEIASALESRFGMVRIADPQAADIRLRITTTDVQVSQRRMVVMDYWLIYMAKIALEDARDGKLIIRGHCVSRNRDSVNKGLDAYLANDMAIFRGEVVDAANYCPRLFVAKSLEGKKG